MAEDTTTNPADLVPFVDNPDPTPTATREEAAKELGYDIENVEKGIGAMQTMREYVDAIPTPGRDEGDALGSFSLFSMTKNVLNGALTLMEAPRTGILRDNPEVGFQAVADMGPGMMSVASRGPAGALGMFGSRPGVWAEDAVHETFAKMSKKADELKASGADEQKIWQESGMARDHEGKWVYEISDGENTKVKWGGIDKVSEQAEFGLADGKAVPLPEILDSPAVFSHWPQFKDVHVQGYRDKAKGAEYGYFNTVTQKIALNLAKLENPNTPNDQWMKTIIHEAQHALQHLQGRPSGTSVEWATAQMTKAIESSNKAAQRALERGDLTDEQIASMRKTKKISEIWQEMHKYMGDMAAYWADPGEVEARLAEKALQVENTRFPPSQRIGQGVPSPDKQFRPEDIGFPARPVEQNQPTGFGKRPVSQSHPMDDPNFNSLPPEVRNVITNEIPPNVNTQNELNSGIPYVSPANKNLPSEYWPMVAESLTRTAQNYREEAVNLITSSDDPAVWERAKQLKQVSQKAEQDALFYQEQIEKGAP